MENSRRTFTRAAVTGLISTTTWLLLALPAGAAAPSATVGVGASGPGIKALEQHLGKLHYFVGTVDQDYDDSTAQAITAYQKVTNRTRTGVVDADLLRALATATDPAPLVPNGGSHRVEVDLTRQVLFLYENNKIAKILAISSGATDTPTPTGDYKIYSQTQGWETSALGQLYNSQYFVGGYAIHGSRSVPAEPASHGCVRITMAAADWLPSHLSVGTPVFVR
jgi:lipoprotein-anchoring transpeptidase ErfK/SrfK